MDSIPKLQTERLKLRAIFPDDAPALLELFSDPNVMRFYDTEPLADVEQARNLIANYIRWFQTDQSIRWGIFLNDNGALVGTCCFDSFLSRNQSINLGYEIRSQDWGHGFATEAARAAITYAFEHGIVGPVNRIEAKTIPANVGSEKVLSKLGFEKEGLMRQYGFWKQQFHDMHLFSITRDQFQDSTRAS